MQGLSGGAAAAGDTYHEFIHGCTGTFYKPEPGPKLLGPSTSHQNGQTLAIHAGASQSGASR
jgi:hypothetical protein